MLSRECRTVRYEGKIFLSIWLLFSCEYSEYALLGQMADCRLHKIAYNTIKTHSILAAEYTLTLEEASYDTLSFGVKFFFK